MTIIVSYQCNSLYDVWFFFSSFFFFKRLRIHPSALAFLYGSDERPPLAVEQAFLAVAHDEQWPVPSICSASNRTSPLLGPSGLKMSGPYSYVPPRYFFDDTQTTTALGGGWGFLSEVMQRVPRPSQNYNLIQIAFCRVGWTRRESSCSVVVTSYCERRT